MGERWHRHCTLAAAGLALFAVVTACAPTARPGPMSTPVSCDQLRIPVTVPLHASVFQTAVLTFLQILAGAMAAWRAAA